MRTPGTARIAAVLAAALLVLPAASASAATADEVTEKVFDVAILRTGGVLKILFGSAILVGAYPVALIGEVMSQAIYDDAPPVGDGGSRDAVQYLVVEPWEYTFDRPLGEF